MEAKSRIYHWRRNGGSGGARPPTQKGGPAPYLPPPPTFHGSPLSALPSVYQFISCHTLGSTALALVCVRVHFRILENEKFSTLCEGEPLPHPPQLSRSAPSYVCAPPLLCCYSYVYRLVPSSSVNQSRIYKLRKKNLKQHIVTLEVAYIF